MASLNHPFLIQVSSDGGATWENTTQSVDDEKTGQTCIEYYNRSDREKRKYRVGLNIDKKAKR